MINLKPKYNIIRDNGKWFVAKWNERGVCTDYIAYEKRSEARTALRELKAAQRGKINVHEFREINNIQ